MRVDPVARERAWTCRLTVVHPPDVSAAFDLDAAPLVFGRQAGAAGERQLAHRTVSRRHLEVAWDPALGRHYARDLDSRNGTWLSGQPLAAIPRVLDDDAVVRLGDVVAVYERHRGDLTALNCAALSPQLIESQLFGHQRRAFTGAVQGSAGLFRAADGGTLFLDEIGELPLDLQPKLLRAIEQGEVLPLGSTTPQRVDVRVIAATNRELSREVDAGRFRRDLYARLALWELLVPRSRAAASTSSAGSIASPPTGPASAACRGRPSSTSPPPPSSRSCATAGPRTCAASSA